MITRNRHDDYFLDCDGCGRVGPWSMDEKRAHWYAAQNGWHTLGDRDYCPTCWAKRNKEAG